MFSNEIIESDFNKGIVSSYAHSTILSKENYSKVRNYLLIESIYSNLDSKAFSDLNSDPDNEKKMNRSNLVLESFNLNCNIIIPKVSQTPKGVYSRTKLCFEYDASGNFIGTKNCDAEILDRYETLEDNGVLALSDEKPLTIEEIKSFIKIYPNPTSGIINVILEEAVYGKINKVEVFNPNGALVKSNNIKPNDSSTTFDIIGYPNGVYLLKFTLISEEFFSINIIKK